MILMILKKKQAQRGGRWAKRHPECRLHIAIPILGVSDLRAPVLPTEVTQVLGVQVSCNQIGFSLYVIVPGVGNVLPK